jgi:hypothetical protein
VSVEKAVAEELETYGKLGKGALAATALELARQLDYGGNSATSKSMCAKALTETLDKLRELAPPKKEEDEVERARKRRADRLARSAATRSSSSS